MAASEDELAKKEIKEAIWTWSGRAVTVAAVFVIGFFAAWWLWGYGPAGAPSLRNEVQQLESQLVDCKNKRVDVEGKLTVTQGRLTDCEQTLSKVRAAAAAAPAQR